MIEHTNNAQQLAAIYTASDMLLNPTEEDNYPTVNLEAEACGTDVATYDIGGCGETIVRSGSFLVSGLSEARDLLAGRLDGCRRA